MLRSYLVIALRNLMRNKVVTGINLVGLSVAIAISAILGIGVHGMLTADWNLREDDRLFRVVTREIRASGQSSTLGLAARGSRGGARGNVSRDRQHYTRHQNLYPDDGRRAPSRIHSGRS